MLGAMVAPVAHAVQTLSVGWKESEVWAEWVTAAGAVFAALFAAWAVYREGQLLESAQDQVAVSQDQIKAMQEQTRAAQSQVEASIRPVLALINKNNRGLHLVNIGNGPALNVRYNDGQPAAREHPLTAFAATQSEPLENLGVLLNQNARVTYESADGIPYLTIIRRDALGAFHQTFERLPKAQGREAAAT